MSIATRAARIVMRRPPLDIKLFQHSFPLLYQRTATGEMGACAREGCSFFLREDRGYRWVEALRSVSSIHISTIISLLSQFNATEKSKKRYRYNSVPTFELVIFSHTLRNTSRCIHFTTWLNFHEERRAARSVKKIATAPLHLIKGTGATHPSIESSPAPRAAELQAVPVSRISL